MKQYTKKEEQELYKWLWKYTTIPGNVGLLKDWIKSVIKKIKNL